MVPHPHSPLHPDPYPDAEAWRWPNFTPDELRCKGSGLIAFHPGFLDALQQLRSELGKPMVITSACRSTGHNAAVGGHPRSLHICDAPQHDGQLGTLAVDVAYGDGAYRGALVSLAWVCGFSVGWGHGFIHLDRRDFVGLPRTTFDY